MKKIYITLLLILGFGLYAPLAHAQSAGQVKLTITPPMIRNNVNPGQIWRSSVKLVNNNSYEINIYVRLNDFKGGQEDGTVEFLPELDPADAESKAFLSQWIEINKGPIPIAPYQSVDIPFSIRVPETAVPGGHYAAILAGTQPESTSSAGSQMSVSSLLASLILLNVQGDVEERGLVREFSTSQKYYGAEDVDFTVRFQNSGNVHIQPQGEIRIYNMWGKDKGVISINQGSAFGNVLPGDIRKWNFDWAHDNSLLEMGRHKAVLILGYGNQARQTVDQTMFFWIIFVKPLLIALGSIAIFISLVVLSIRFYIRRAILRTQKEIGLMAPAQPSPVKMRPKAVNNAAVVNLKTSAAPVQNVSPTPNKVGWAFFRNYSRAIVIVLLIVMGGLAYIYYQRNHNTVEIPADEIPNPRLSAVVAPVADETPAADIAASDIATATATEAVTPITPEAAPVETAPKIDNEAFTLRIANGSGLVGAASDVDKALYAGGYRADQLGNADNFNYQITLIKYKAEFEREAQAISRLIDVQVEMQKVAEQTEDILVIVGKNIR